MRKIRRRRNPNYLLPFFFLVGLGVVIVLSTQIWSFFFPALKGDALFYTVEGRAKILSFGSTEWGNAYNGVKIKLGDSVKTPVIGKAVIKFYDDTVLRMGDDTELTLVDITKKDDKQEILLSLNRGMIWVNKPRTENVKPGDFSIITNYANYTVTGTIFSIEKSVTESLKVLKGNVKVDIIELDQDKRRVIESVNHQGGHDIVMNQEVDLDDSVMKAFFDRQSPSVIKTIDDAFKNSPWYLWNTQEDKAPTDFSKSNSQTSTSVNSSNVVTSSSVDSVDQAANSNNLTNSNSATVDNTAPNPSTSSNSDISTEVKSTLEAPTIISPKQSSIETDESSLKITGTVPQGIKKIYVLQKLANNSKEEKILLTKYKAGSTTWSYNLLESYLNIYSGVNTYTFVAVDNNDLETEGTTLTVTFNKKKIIITDPLVAPVVTKIDNKVYSEAMIVANNTFKIQGTIQGAEKLAVNGYILSQFTPGSKNWSYNVNEGLGNLKAGNNTYEIYGIGSDGKKSQSVMINLNYQKPIIEQVDASTSSSQGNTSSNTTTNTVNPTSSTNSSSNSVPLSSNAVVPSSNASTSNTAKP